jgi:hypothetical protein
VNKIYVGEDRDGREGKRDGIGDFDQEVEQEDRDVEKGRDGPD